MPLMTRQRRKSLLKKLLLPIVSAAFLGYFGFHAYSGFYGIKSHERLEKEVAILSAELDRLKEERKGIERRVHSLRPERLDADLVDSEARIALNRLRPDEVLVDLGASHKENP
jgi:cell division protein FtsB